jgi:hypothetical protein
LKLPLNRLLNDNRVPQVLASDMNRMPVRVPTGCRAGALAGALAVSLLASCTTITTAPPNSPLTGHWLLDPAASDDAGMRVAQAVAEYRKKMRSRRPSGATDGGLGPGSGGGGGGGRRGSGAPGSGQGTGQGQAPEPEPDPAQGSAPRTDSTDDAPESIIDQYGNTRLLGPDFRAISVNLVHAVSSPRELDIDVDGDSVRVRAERLPAREYRLGEKFSRIDELGTAHMQPSWSDNGFVLRARYSEGVNITERFEVLQGQSTLTRTIKLVDPLLGKLQLHSTYRPAPH